MSGAIPVSASGGLLRIASNADLVRQEEAAARQAAEENNNQPVLRGLAGHVMGCWESARAAKTVITERLLSAQRARQGKYDPAKEAAIKEFGGSEEYARITDNKCRTAAAWLKDVYLGQTDMPWTLKPTPIPSLPDDSLNKIKAQVGQEIAQAFAATGQAPAQEDVAARMDALRDAETERINESARETTERMASKIEDQMAEGGWAAAFADFLDDLVTYPAAHFKAPVLRKRSTVVWNSEGGTWTPRVEESIGMDFERVDPFRIYPSPGATDPQDGSMCEILPYSRDDLYSLIGVPGFDEAAIRAVLEEYGRGGLINWLGISPEYQKNAINDTLLNSQTPGNVDIECLEFHGPVRGRDLLEWGMDESMIDDPDKDYEATVWLIGRWVIKAQLNPDPLKKRPYYKASYQTVPGSYWGNGLVDLLDDVQGVVNAAVRSLVNNMGMASGPMLGVNVDRLAPGEELTTLRPWQIVQLVNSEYGNNADRPLEFFQPQSNVNDLLVVLNRFYDLADDFSMVPRVMAGQSPTGGVGRSASGMSMMMNAANKGLKGIVSAIDTNVLTPMLTSVYNYNMLFDPDMSIKGDAQVVASGATSLMQLESLQLRRNEFLTSTNNPNDMQIVGVEGRAEVLREVAKGLDIDVNRIIPSRTQLQAMQQQNDAAQAAQQQQGAGQPPAPGGVQLQDGSAVTNNFGPSSLRQPS
jgi:hypothetical protein